MTNITAVHCFHAGGAVINPEELMNHRRTSQEAAGLQLSDDGCLDAALYSRILICDST